MFSTLSSSIWMTERSSASTHPCGQKLNKSSDLFAPILQRFFHQSHELIGNGAVDETVIVAERQMHQRADRDGIIAVAVGDDNRSLRDPAHSHNGGVGLIDDGEPEDCAELSRIRDGERGPFYFVGL